MLKQKQNQLKRICAYLTAIVLIAWPFGSSAGTTADSFVYPLKSYVLTSDFGDDRGGIYHLGEDAAGAAGTAVYSIGNGYIKHIGEHTRFGTVVLIEHTITGRGKVVSLYGHLRSPDIKVAEKQFVSKGQLIGYLGTTGENGGWGEHLHFGIHKGAYVDVDERWIYWGLNRSIAEMENWYDPSDFINGYDPVSYDPDDLGKIVTSAGSGGSAHVRVFGSTGQAVKGTDFFAFGDESPGGADIAVGDIDHDGVQEIVVGAGPGNKPYVKIFDKNTQELEKTFLAYGDDFRGGVRVAIGNINGGEYQEIITGAGPGGGAQARVFSHNGSVILPKLFPFGENQRSGLDVAAGDTNGDGIDEIIVGAGPGGEPKVRIYNGNGRLASTEITAFATNFRGGIRVAAGDIDGDEVDEIIVGAGQGGGPHVRVFEPNGRPRPINIFPFHSSFRGGVDVASYDHNEDGKDDIVVSQTSGGQAWVKVVKYNNEQTILAEFNAYADFQGGANVTAVR
ncbi:MAG: VCBS repeat domain-containing M23 family metallopeptidase [Parcubacteria group bacterium]|nr:VCBS repeat domain-containing M23 family metallopeptidase [Parcubacteria group bacterium]